MTVVVDVCLVEGLALPYVSGAEAALSDPQLDPVFATAWAGLLELFPGLSLEPLFDALPTDALADLVDAVRMGGEEPPDPFSWFSVSCDDAEADLLAASLVALPMVASADRRSSAVVAGISYGTNPETILALQVQEAPNGVDAIYAWAVAGGTGRDARIADVEGGWDLGHDDLLTARITKASVFGASEVDHGTAVAGILVGADNGVGLVGIVPDASLALVTVSRGFVDNSAGAVTAAANAVGPGGVVLLEIALSFFAGPPHADVLVEFDRPVQVAIRLATLFGITVVEAAGNGGVDLDAVPALAHTRPGSATFVDSLAIVVGAGELQPPELDHWVRSFSSFGSRVDCFAAGSLVRAPSSSAPNAYQNFRGTSSASAVVAGVVASIQSMSLAATGRLLAPTDIRRLLRDPALGTPVANSVVARIGGMPDLRKIARALGFARVLPVGAATVADDAAVVVHLDDDDLLVRRHWTVLTGWGAPLPLPAASAQFDLNGGRAAVLSTEETDPVERLVHEAFAMGPAGVHHLFWNSNDQAGDLSAPVSAFSAVAQSSWLASVRARLDRVVVVGVSPAARLVAMTGDPQVLVSTQLSAPLVLDPVSSFRRCPGPAVVSRSEGTVDVVAVEDGGTLRWYAGTTLATLGTGFEPGVSEPSGTVLDPEAVPALAVTGALLTAAAVELGGLLQVFSIDPVARTVGGAVVVDPSVHVAASGPVALASAGTNLVALAIDLHGVLRAATRPLAGGAFTPLLGVPALPGSRALSPLGGVTAVTVPDVGLMALVVDVDGAIRFTLSADGLVWLPLVAV